jgi:hypothetical protein
MRRKKSTGFVLALLALLLSGCAGTDAAQAQPTAEVQTERYSVRQFEATEFFGDFRGQAICQGQVFCLDYSGTPTLRRADAAGTATDSFPLELPETVQVGCLTATGNELWCLGYSVDQAGAVTGLDVFRLDPDSGAILEQVALATVPGSTVDGLAMDADGRFYVLSDRAVTVYAHTGAELGCGSAGAVNQLAVTESGQIVLLDQQFSPYLLDPETLLATGLDEFEFRESGENAEILTGIGYALFVHTDSGLYGYDLDGTWTQLLAYDQLDETLGSCCVLGAVDASTWVYDATANTTTPSGLVVTTAAEQTEKTHLTVAALSDNYQLKTMISAFNYAQTDYTLDYLCYAEEYQMSDAALLERLRIEFAAGRLPDILVCSNEESDLLDTLTGADYLTDLYGLMEQDETFALDDYFTNVWNAMAVDGALYQLCPTFQVRCLVGRADTFSQWDGSIPALQAIQAAAPDVTLLGNVSREEVLRWNCTREALSSFVDWDAGTCDFTGAAFASLLSFLAEFPEEVEDDDGLAARLLNGSADLYYARSLLPAQDTAQWSTLYQGDFCYLPLATWNGGSVQIVASECFSITTACAAPEAAWAFLKTFLTADYQAGQTLPMLRAALDDELSLLCLPHEDPDSPYYGFRSAWNGIAIEAPTVTTADTDQIYALINAATVSATVESQLYTIIAEEAAAYFAGSKSLQAVTSLIQDRIQTYLWEVEP